MRLYLKDFVDNEILIKQTCHQRIFHSYWVNMIIFFASLLTQELSSLLQCGFSINKVRFFKRVPLKDIRLGTQATAEQYMSEQYEIGNHD